MAGTLIAADKLAAYQETHYRYVVDDVKHVLRIGVRSASMELLMRRSGTDTALFVTAFNPFGTERDPQANDAAHEQLHEDLRRLTHYIFEGEGADPGGLWPPEKSLLALGLTEAHAMELAVRYAQDAVVWMGSDAVPMLMLTR
jgi:hypothetical protein